MSTGCTETVAAYLEYLGRGFECERHGDECLIATPFFRPDNAAIELWILPERDGRLIVTDAGETFAFLFTSGVNTTTKACQERLRIISHRFAVAIGREEISTVTPPDGVAESIHRVLGAIQDVAQLVNLKRGVGPTEFEERVRAFLDVSGFEYDTGHEIQGAADSHSFPIFVNHNRNLAISPIGSTKATYARRITKVLGYHILDIRQATDVYSFMAVLDDTSSGLSKAEWEEPEVYNPLRHCNYVYFWSERERITDTLRK